MSIIGSQGVRGLQGRQGPYGPRGYTGLGGWTQQPYMNIYGTNPLGPVGKIGQLVVTGTYSTGTVSLTNASAGTIYNLTSDVTLTISSPTVGTFWMVKNTSSSSISMSYPISGGLFTTISLAAGKMVSLVASASDNIVVF
jgi:hypothetical protein